MSQPAPATGVNVARAHTDGFRRASVLAFLLCGLLTLSGLLVPPSLSHDAGWGMQEWRTLEAGGPINAIISPDPADISRDLANHITWWSPGQYVAPGILTLLGIRIGTALTITAGVSLFCCLLGWIELAKHFAFSPRMVTLLVVLMATFRYSTLPFGIYNGGEILLQGITPWLILAGCRVPITTVVRAAGLACLAVLIAFFAKLTGVMVASAALLAGSVEALVRMRRITAGMVAGAVGATVAFGLLYVGWFSRGATPASGTGWSFHVGDVLFAMGAPWGAGISWTDMLTSVLFNARHPIVHGGPDTDGLFVILWLLLPPILLFVTVILKGWKPCVGDANLSRLLMITVCFYVVCAVAMGAIFSRGGDVSLEERHLRAAGMLIFVCVLAVTDRLPRRSLSHLAVSALCVLMSLYGCVTFVYRAWSTKAGDVDHYSRTHQPHIDRSAIEFVRATYGRQGREAVFVLPSPDAACAFLPSARILSNYIEVETEAIVSSRIYRGKVRGGLYVIMPTEIAQSAKGALLLKEFADYPFNAWEANRFGTSTVFSQGGGEETPSIPNPSDRKN